MKKFLIVMLILVSFFCGACLTASASAAQDGQIRIYRQSEVGLCKTMSVVDHDTGVNYVVFVSGDTGVAMCPRYNADGTFYLSLVD